MRPVIVMFLAGCGVEHATEPDVRVEVICSCPPPPSTALTEDFASDGIADQVFHLADVPDAPTMQVTVTEDGYTSLFKQYDPVTGLGDWELDASENGVVFLEYVPAAGANVAVHYEPLNDRDDVVEGLGDGCCG